MKRSDETLDRFRSERVAFVKIQHAIEAHQHGESVIPLLRLVQRYGSAARERALSEAKDAIDAVPLS